MDDLFREEVIAQRAGRSLGRVTLPATSLPANGEWISFFGGTRVRVMLQTESAECGLACLAMVASYHGADADLATLRRRWAVSTRGATLAQLISISQGVDLSPRPLRLDLDDLARLRCPAILHWNLDHFVVLERVHGNRARIVDPAIGRRTVSGDELSASFTGIALELEPTRQFEPRREPSRLPLASFFTGTPGLYGALARLLGLSLALQALVLVAPLFSQLVIDKVIADGDTGLLTISALAFLLVAAIQVCIGGVRGWYVAVLGTNLRLAWCARLFHHLLRLPLGWFERRHVGDIVSRFGSLRAVEGMVTGTVVEGVVDGLLVLTTLVVMLCYSIQLTLVVLAAVAVYALARAILLPPMRRVAHEALALEAREQSLFMESVRAILPLKNFGREGEREATWRNRKSASLRAAVRVARLRIIQQCVNGMVLAVAGIAVLWVGAHAVIAGALTIGMLVAFIAYKAQFTMRAVALIDRIVQFRLLGVHLDRIADIALADREDGYLIDASGPAIKGALSAHNLSFRYANTEPMVIRDVNLEIAAGECVAITAPSGTGKSTLMKILLGLLQPTTGRVCIDGTVLSPGMVRGWRRQVGAVLQDDILFSGSLAENVACFDPAPDYERLDECARMAALNAEISRMPMGWHTLVGDMGSALSGGQRQRLLLARALYDQPRILFLDEATSHLDPTTESSIHATLAAMRITRVLVAHRRETLAIADRVIELRAA